MTADRVMLDTNIVSYLMKGHALASSYAPHVQGRLATISFVTVGELYLWAEVRSWGEAKRHQLEAQFRNFAVVPYDNAVAWHYAQVSAARRRQGEPITANDAWIAACARRHGVPLITHNAKDFGNIPGLTIISENPNRHA